MTVLTKFGVTEKKDQLPLVNETPQNEAKLVIDTDEDSLPGEGVQNYLMIRRRPDAYLSHLCCIVLTSLLVMSLGIIGGMQMYIHINRQNSHRYQGWCAIPYDSNNDQKLIEPHFRIMSMPQPLFSANSHDIELLEDLPRTLPDQPEDYFSTNYLKETFEIGDHFERFIIPENSEGRQTNILHDFKSNYSGIINTDRCFVMVLNPKLVMPPNVFVSTIQGQSDFDVTRVHEVMRALLPALENLSEMGPLIEKECVDKPTYKLKLQPEGTIRKRSADLPNDAKFTQFSGKHVQEIDIDNINELLAYEEKVADLV